MPSSNSNDPSLFSRWVAVQGNIPYGDSDNNKTNNKTNNKSINYGLSLIHI
jgi:hypothetical protein